MSDWYRIEAKADKSAEIQIYGDIGESWWGESVSAKQFAKDFKALDADRITIHVNSLGGSVFDGLAILNTIRQSEATVTVIVDGIAASAASFLALGGDELVMGRNSQMMIHDASGGVWGTAADMAKHAETLDKISDNIAAIYAEKAGGEPTEWRDIMRAETWYTADEAEKAGLANRVDQSRTKTPPLEAAARMGAPKGRPAPIPEGAGRHGRVSPAAVAAVCAVAGITPDSPAIPAEAPAPQPEPNPKERKVAMSDALLAGLRERLGVPADAELSEDAALAALDEALAERATEQPQASTPEGVVMIDEAILADLRAAASDGRAARAEQVSARRAGVVEAAIKEGRIAPARREHWLAQLEADEEGASSVLASLAANTIPVEPIGYVGGVDESSDEDRLYTKVASLTGRKEN